MALVMKACVILHNMIMEDEWNDKNLNHDYLFVNEDGSQFKVDKVWKDPTTTSFAAMKMNRKNLMDKDKHKEFKSDLSEHLWALRGK